MYAEGLDQTQAGSVVATSISLRPYEPCLADSVGHFFPGVLNPSVSYNPSHLFQGVPQLCLMFSCGSLHLLPSAVGRNLSDDDWSSH